MAWSRDEPDPLRAKRRQLANQEKELALRMSQLTEELRRAPNERKKAPEPPVWRLEDEISPRQAAESTSARRRNLARQTRRDKILFFLFIAVLLVVSCIFFWVYETHLQGGG